MPRTRYASGAPWEAAVGYSRAVRVGPFVHVAGTTATDADGAPLAPGDAGRQAEIVLAKVRDALERAGAGLADVVRTRIYVTDIADWPAVGRAHGAAFGDVRPAATMVQVAALIDPALVVEIEADAIVAEPPGDGADRAQRRA